MAALLLARKLLLHRRPTFPGLLLSSFLHHHPLLLGFSHLFSSSSHNLPPAQVGDPADDATQRPDHARIISIDRSGLCSPSGYNVGWNSGRYEETSLSKHIKSLIMFRGGPITVAEYMEEVLTNPTAGFYMHRDVFGAAGDFITSPDVSQMFGELVGVWSMCLWQQMGEPKEVNLVELGPGRGTLMADLLRGTAKFENFARSISVHFVECSPTLRKIQQQTLRCKLEGQEPTPVEIPGPGTAFPSEEIQDQDKRQLVDGFSQLSGAHLSWHHDLNQVPRGVPTIIIAHEFFDALPIHQFLRTDHGWCEKLVDVAEGLEQGLRFVLSRGPTDVSRQLLAKRFKWASVEERAKFKHVEVCPQALEITQEIAHRVAEDGGGALIIDYGENGMISDSLQAISNHKFVPVLDNPGMADLSAYVDFAALRHSVKEAAVGASAFGPIPQSQFLGMLGINFRLEALLKNASAEQAEPLQSGYWRLVGDGVAPWWEGEENLAPIGMGSRYKALAIVNSLLGAPICFQ